MLCHICNNTVTTFTHTKSKILYYHCESCEYIFKSPLYYQDFSTQEERYNLHTNHEEDLGYIAYFQRFLDFVLPHIDTPKNALDFGCGCSSLLASLFIKLGISCDYYDPIYHPHTLDKSKKYDLIVSTEVFEHLHQPRKVFEDLIQRLSPEGYLAIQTQFHPNDKEAFKQWYYHQDPTHIVFFRAKTFKILAHMYGCEYLMDNDKNMVIIRKTKGIQ